MSVFPPIFNVAKSASAVTALLGTPPAMRFYLFGEATQDTAKPYAVWQTVSGYPENYLGDRPDTDHFTTQVDVYGTTASSARAVAKALRDAFDAVGVAYVVSWRGESRDATTGNFRIGFDVAWIEYR